MLTYGELERRAYANGRVLEAEVFRRLRREDTPADGSNWRAGHLLPRLADKDPCSGRDLVVSADHPEAERPANAA